MGNWNLGTALTPRALQGTIGVSGQLQYVNPLTTATLSGPSNGLLGQALIYTVTLNVPANQTVTVTPTCPGATVSPGTFTITAGNISGTFNVTAPADGIYSVDFTISPVLTRANRPISVTIVTGWDATIPTQNGQVGVPFSVDLDDFFNSVTAPTYALSSGSLPAGLSLGSTRNHILSGTPTTAQTVSPIFVATVAAADLEADWASRAAFAVAAGGRAIRFNTSAETLGTPLTGNTNGYVNSGVQAEFDTHIFWEQTIKRSGAGSLRFNILNIDGENSGAWRWHVKPSFANISSGEEYYVQWSQYFPPEYCFAIFPGNGSEAPFANGFKHLILSHYGVRIGPNSWGAESGSETAGSNNGEAVVIENSQQMGGPRVYYYDPNISRDATETPISISQCTNAVFKRQNAIDNGTPTVVDCATAQQRFGPLYAVTPTHSGTPSPNNGGLVYVPGWMTFMVRVKPVYNSPLGIIELWGAIAGQAPRKSTTTAVAQIGLGSLGQGHGGLHFLPYNTGKTAGVGYDTFTCYTEILTSLGANPIPFPGGFNVTPR